MYIENRYGYYKESSIHKVRTNAGTEGVNILKDFTTVVINNLCSLESKLTHENHKCDNTKCETFQMRMKITAIEFAESITKLKGLLYHVAHEVQDPEYCRNGEDFGPQSVYFGTPESDSFDCLNRGGNVNKRNCGHC